MWRFVLATALLAACLVGCSSGKDFEKDILGHPAPESPNDTGWSRTPPPPPPPPAAAPRPVPPAPQGPAPAVAATAPPSAAAPAPLAPPPTERPRTPEAPPQPAVAGERMVLTFQVGSFAHVENARELMHRLEARGYSTRMDQGRTNNRAYFMVYASKEGSQAALEGDLFACGVSEPVLAEERPLNGPASGAPSSPIVPPPPGKGQAPASAPEVKSKTPVKTPPAVKASPATKAPAKAGQIKAVTSPPANPQPAAKTGTSKPSAPPASSQGSRTLPGVEPAPPLPDGYVPPPPKAAGS
jgi:Meckel syndrome type 1 protein